MVRDRVTTINIINIEKKNLYCCENILGNYKLINNSYILSSSETKSLSTMLTKT